MTRFTTLSTGLIACCAFTYRHRISYWIAGAIILPVFVFQLIVMASPGNVRIQGAPEPAASLVRWSGPEDASPTWGDYGRAAIAGVHGLRRGAHAIGRYFADKQGDVMGARYHLASQELAEIDAEDLLAGMTPGARARLNRSPISR
jgi:hypothetical protein